MWLHKSVAAAAGGGAPASAGAGAAAGAGRLHSSYITTIMVTTICNAQYISTLF